MALETIKRRPRYRIVPGRHEKLKLDLMDNVSTLKLTRSRNFTFDPDVLATLENLAVATGFSLPKVVNGLALMLLKERGYVKVIP
jgi:hypothetical protein